MDTETTGENLDDDSTVGDPESPWMNALIGATVTVLTAFIPFSPALGGGVAGYLQQGGDREGLRVGALSGLLAAVPIMLVFGLICFVLFLGIAVSGEVAGPLFVVGILVVIALFVIGYTVVLSAVGGLVGAALADREKRSTAVN
jgi:uncharacterized membrane protein YbhN (UPF0104 family)